MGVFAKTDIAPHTTVGDYKGEPLTQRDVDVRYGLNRASPEWTETDEEWMRKREDLAVECTGRFIFKVCEDLFLDSEDYRFSCWTRFLNHGEANLKVKSLPRGFDGEPRVWFVSTREILAGEELVWDYGEEYWLEDDLVV